MSLILLSFKGCIVKIIIFLDKKKEFFLLAKGGFWAVNGQKKAKKIKKNDRAAFSKQRGRFFCQYRVKKIVIRLSLFCRILRYP